MFTVALVLLSTVSTSDEVKMKLLSYTNGAHSHTQYTPNGTCALGPVPTGALLPLSPEGCGEGAGGDPVGHMGGGQVLSQDPFTV